MTTQYPVLTSGSFAGSRPLQGKQFRDSSNLGRSLAEVYKDIDAGFLTMEATPRLTQLAAQTQVGNDISIDITIVNQTATVVEEVVACRVQMFDTNMTPVVAGAFTVAIGGTGTALSTDDQAQQIILTSAAGVAEIVITDAAPASGLPVIVLVTPISNEGGTVITSSAPSAMLLVTFA